MKNRNSSDRIALLMELLSISGKSLHEKKTAEYIIKKAIKYGVDKKNINIDEANLQSPHGGEIGNLYIHLPGTYDAKEIMFSAHMDTVEIVEGAVPKIVDEYICSQDMVGLGADDRTGLAVLLNTIREIYHNQLEHSPITFMFSVQEEIGLLGTKYMSKKLSGSPSFCYNFDGQSPNTIITNGIYSNHFDITIYGRSAHSGVCPEKGISAAEIFAKALAKIIAEGYFGEVIKNGKKIGTSNIGIVTGGDGRNIVMGDMRIKGEARSFTKASLNEITKRYKDSFEKEAELLFNADGARGNVEFKLCNTFNGFRISKKNEYVERVIKSLVSLGLEPVYSKRLAGLDSNNLNCHEIPSITLGAGTRFPHTTNEKCYIKDFDNACELALMLIKE
ncbi:MAG: M20/M25/M40 family metallo-hydrolase [Proteobacteria bacterium]|nr:M20/M25/M40 family metallo-hydrolase [Pseudomonadota bacterium]